jgi:hypothetical protein
LDPANPKRNTVSASGHYFSAFPRVPDSAVSGINDLDASGGFVEVAAEPVSAMKALTGIWEQANPRRNYRIPIWSSSGGFFAGTSRGEWVCRR